MSKLKDWLNCRRTKRNLFCSTSHVSDVYVEFIKGQWVAWRESFILIQIIELAIS